MLSCDQLTDFWMKIVQKYFHSTNLKGLKPALLKIKSLSKTCTIFKDLESSMQLYLKYIQRQIIVRHCVIIKGSSLNVFNNKIYVYHWIRTLCRKHSSNFVVSLCLIKMWLLKFLVLKTFIKIFFNNKILFPPSHKDLLILLFVCPKL